MGPPSTTAWARSAEHHRTLLAKVLGFWWWVYYSKDREFQWTLTFQSKIPASSLGTTGEGMNPKAACSVPLAGQQRCVQEPLFTKDLVQ